MADGLAPIALVPQLSNSSTLPGEDELIIVLFWRGSMWIYQRDPEAN